ncbi:nitroreductase family deazaflavin-dependent oxidoreductase [Kribbella sp. NBC_01505]|uniref:nitroreductase/quinone reductase family protein n=1 Tax=Kribbella sp. NBC_01505 TaxID=2903580 RepID=UPI00386A8ED2
MWEHNPAVIANFRANGGKISAAVRPELAGMDVVLIGTTGARTGKKYVIPLVYFSLGDDLFVVGSAGGSATTPSWTYNLRAHPEVEVERGTDKYPGIAVPVDDPDERARLYAQAVETKPAFGSFEKKSGRVIPVFIIKRR